MAARAAGNVRVSAALAMAIRVDARNKNLFRMARFVPALCVQGVCKVAHSGRGDLHVRRFTGKRAQVQPRK